MPSEVVNILQSIHLMDLLLVVLIGGLAVYGFVRGVANVAIILISTYLGFAIASIYYVPFGRLLGGLLNVSIARVAEIFAFLFLNVLMAVLLSALLHNVLGNLQMPGKAGAFVDRPFGMMLGFASGIIIAAIFIVLFSVPYEKYDEIKMAGGQAPMFGVFNFWYQGSWLAPELRKLAPALLASIAPLTGPRLPRLIMNAGLILPFFLLKFKPEADKIDAEMQ